MNSLIFRSFAFLALCLILIQPAISAEFLVRDEITVVRTDVDPWQGSTKWDYDGAGPDSWLSPDDFYNGTFYFRFEIIDQPTNRACAAQFVIWQDWNYPEWKEQAAGHVSLNGEGTVAYSSGTPASWWAHDDVPLDFSRPHDFWKLGIMFWSAEPWGLIAAFMADRPEVDIYDEIWADQGDWFPMTFRLTVVAVSAGSTFSGDWAQYMGGATGVQPDYSINYSAEETNENVLEQHEYSYDNSTWHDGAGSRLSLSPSSTVYFRDKIDNGLTQTLTAPGRLSTPSFSVDYEDEQTAEAISSAYEYSTASNMTGATTGSGVVVSLTPGTDMYFRQLATGSAFKSEIQTMDVSSRPSAPSFSINYEEETTTGTVSSTIEYSLSSDMSGAQAGSNMVVMLTPGSDAYFRISATSSAFASGIFQLDVPGRPVAPAYSIDYSTEATDEDIPISVVYADNSEFTGALSGDEVAIFLTPGEDLYFKFIATSSAFASEVFMLDVPERPDAPIFEINFENETTQENIDADVIYSANVEFTEAQTGAGAPVNLTPGEDIYFRVEASSSSFASNIFLLEVPERPVLSSESTSPTSDNPIHVNLSFDYATSNVVDGKLVSGNSTFVIIGGKYDIDLTPIADGAVVLQALAGAVPEGSFASEVFSITYEAGNSLDQPRKNLVEVFPNPTPGILNLSFNAGQEPERIIVMDKLGRIVTDETWDSGQQILDLSHLPTGIYSLKILNTEFGQEWHTISIAR